MAMDADTQNSSQNKRGLVKRLGSRDRRIQDKAIALLRPWLTSQKEMSEEELKKICKGVFYFILSADKQVRQGTSIGKLPSTVENLDLNLARHYFQAFFMTIRREWRGTDLFRLDMFYLLLVRILQGMFPAVDSNGWDSKLVDGFLGGMTEKSLLVVDKLPIQRMNFRFADGYLNEFHCVFPVQLDNFVPMTEPFYPFFAMGLSRLLLNREDDNVFACFLKNGRNLLKIKQEGQDVDDKVENLGPIVLSSSLSQQVTFPSTLQDNEKVLHDSQKEFKGFSKLLTPSGILILLESIMKLKIFCNISAEQSVDSKTLSINELPADSVSPLHSEHVNNTESIKQIGEEVQNEFDNKIGLGKPQPFENNISENLTWKCNGKAATGIFKSSEMRSNSEAEEIQDFPNEATLNHACSYEDAINEVNGRERLELLDGESGDFKHACSYEEVTNEVNGRERLELLDGESGDLEMTDVSVISDHEQHCEETVLAVLDNCTSPTPSLLVPVSPLQTGSKKRKRPQNGENELPGNLSPAKYDENEEDFFCSDLLSGVVSAGKSAQRKVKRVRFSLKNNLVWKPYSPLPPESLRVPPSATPRGSALKKGVPPGPICIIKNSPRKKSALRQRSAAVRKTPKNTKCASSSSMVLRSQRPVAR